MAEAKNGNGLSLNGSSLASLAGAKARLTESVRFDVRSLDDALSLMRKLGTTGELTLKINQGRVSGEAQFDTHVKVGS